MVGAIELRINYQDGETLGETDLLGETEADGDTEGDVEDVTKVILVPCREYINRLLESTYNPFSVEPNGLVAQVFPKRINPPFTFIFFVVEYG